MDGVGWGGVGVWAVGAGVNVSRLLRLTRMDDMRGIVTIMKIELQWQRVFCSTTSDVSIS